MNFRTLVLTVVMALGSPLCAATLFSDNFEEVSLSASNWLVLGHSEIVLDPFDASNRVLAFNALATGGDLFSVLLPMGVPQVTLSFDYLGLDGAGTNAGTDTGGFVIVDFPSSFFGTVLLGTSASGGPHFKDMENLTPGVWEHISVTFDPATYGLGNNSKLACEEWASSPNSPGNAFFDNIQLVAAPEPGSAFTMLGGTSLLLAGSLRFRRGLRKRCL
jgi:hypothetical protein